MVFEPRKKTYGVVAVSLLVALAGCGLFGGGGCGPGDTEIGNAADAEGSISVTGEVTESAQASFNIDDGTGKAFIQGQSDVSEGDCVTVEGRTTLDNSGGDSGVDVAIVPSNITVN